MNDPLRGSRMSERTEWSSLRKETAYEESKRVMEGQKSDIDDMDDKALRTVRLTAAILAVGATGVEIISVENINVLLAGFSLSFFVSSAIFGLIVYNESNILVGPKASFLNKMRTGETDDDWETDLLREMENWISSNQERVELNGALLNICQLFFILGVVIGVPAILGLSAGDFKEKEIKITALSILVIYAAIIGYLRWTFK